MGVPAAEAERGRENTVSRKKGKEEKEWRTQAPTVVSFEGAAGLVHLGCTTLDLVRFVENDCGEKSRSVQSRQEGKEEGK
jgi:hypothetical protein